MPRIIIRVITLVFVLVAGVLVTGGLVYLRDPAHALPTFFPGHDVRSAAHHTKRGVGLIILSAVALGAAWTSTAPDQPRDTRRWARRSRVPADTERS
jgi:hypothetical protein